MILISRTKSWHREYLKLIIILGLKEQYLCMLFTIKEEFTIRLIQNFTEVIRPRSTLHFQHTI